jgi:presenilin-like A22 family membrane protease
MKHTLKVTIALVLFFFMAQFTGLLIINHYIDHKKTAATKSVEWKPLPYSLERPQVKNQSTSFIYITIAILIGTILALLLIKFNRTFIWKLWFFATVWLTLSIAFAAFLNNFIAAVLALIISVLKLYKPGIIIQNLSEIFIYGGLAAIFVPMINLFAAFMLLIVISVYDFVAVFKTKHMIKLAEFQSQSKVFAGLIIPYEKGKISIKSKAAAKLEAGEKKAKIAVLGGGDIGFTLIFAGVVMKNLMLQETLLIGFLKAMIIPLVVSLTLLVLLLKSRQNKFYPAMPVLSIGCFIGYLVVLLI